VARSYFRTEGRADDVGRALLNTTGHRRATADALHQSARRVTVKSARRVQGRPGGGSYKREPGAYSSEKVRGGAAVGIRGGGTAIGAEYGTEVHMVFGRFKVAGAMKRRVFPPNIAATDATDGYVVGQTIKDTMPETQKDVRDAVLTEMAKDLARAGARVRKAF